MRMEPLPDRAPVEIVLRRAPPRDWCGARQHRQRQQSQLQTHSRGSALYSLCPSSGVELAPSDGKRHVVPVLASAACRAGRCRAPRCGCTTAPQGWSRSCSLCATCELHPSRVPFTFSGAVSGDHVRVCVCDNIDGAAPCSSDKIRLPCRPSLILGSKFQTGQATPTLNKA